MLVIPLSGIIAADTVLSNTGDVYSIADDLTIAAGVTLTINPGVQVNTPETFADIFVNGTLAATGVNFTGQTQVIVNNSGRFNLNQSQMAGQSVFFDTASLGQVTNNTFHAAQLQVFSAQVAVDNNTFEINAPVLTNPSLVPEFYNNTFAANSRILVQGTAQSNAVWQPIANLARYDLNDDVVINGGVTITISSGVQINTPETFADFFVNGTLAASGVNFTGQTQVFVNNSGRFDLSQSQMAGQSVFFDTASLGQVTNNTFHSAPLQVFSAQVAVDNNTFEVDAPVLTNPSLVPEFYNNTFAANSRILVEGTAQSSVTWQTIPNLARYDLNQDVVISGGVTLTINSGVQVNVPSNQYEFFVDGTLAATGVSFTGSSDIRINAGGRLNLSLSQFTGELIWFNSATSQGLVNSNNFHSGRLDVFSPLVPVDNNVFVADVPARTNPSFVPEFYNNTFAPNSRMQVEGTAQSSVTWQPITNLARYDLSEDVVINGGVTLTISSGVQVDTPSNQYEFFVNGTLAATGVNFTGSSDIRINAGGRLNLSSSQFAGELIWFNSTTSQGLVNSNNFHSGRLDVFSPLVPVDNNVFVADVPVRANPSLVPEFYDNTFAPNSRMQVEGTAQSNAVWQPITNLARYDLSEDVVINGGVTITISPGVQVDTPSNQYEFFVNGTLAATGVNFTGSSDIRINSGGRLNLGFSQFSGELIWYNSATSQGVVNSNNFHSGRLDVFSPLVPVDNNVFIGDVPVRTNPSFVPEFYNNTFAPNSRMQISGIAQSNAALPPINNLTRYELNEDVVIDGGTTLFFSNVQVNTPSNQYEFFVNGTLVANGVTFTGFTEAVVGNAATLQMCQSQIDGGRIDLNPGALASLMFVTLKSTQLEIDSTVAVMATLNDFSTTTVMATGNSAATINLSQNYWGTTNIATIESRITDHDDNPSLPQVEVSPVLSFKIIPGDFDLNGTVAAADYDLWRSTFLSTTDHRADHNCDGVVDAADFVLWRNNLGMTSGTAAASEVGELELSVAPVVVEIYAAANPAELSATVASNASESSAPRRVFLESGSRTNIAKYRPARPALATPLIVDSAIGELLDCLRWQRAGNEHAGKSRSTVRHADEHEVGRLSPPRLDDLECAWASWKLDT